MQTVAEETQVALVAGVEIFAAPNIAAVPRQTPVGAGSASLISPNLDFSVSSLHVFW